MSRARSRPSTRTGPSKRTGFDADSAGSSLPCAICGHGGRGSPALQHLTHGISVWLCPVHRGDAFMRRRSGRAFVDRLAAVWAASGVLTVRRHDALEAHLRRTQTATAAGEQPGSYSWPMLRREAERRFAAGEAPATVIAELRQDYRDGPAMVPSVRTMRRWYSQARWLAKPLQIPRPRSRRSTTQGRLKSGWEPFVNLVVTGVAHLPASTPHDRPRGP